MDPEQQTGPATAERKSKRATAVLVEPAYTSAKAMTGWGAMTIWALI
jgi:hypothetical protein